MAVSYNWMWDKLPALLIEAERLDCAIQVIPWYGDNAGVVHGIKDNIHVCYTVYLEDGCWQFERRI